MLIAYECKELALFKKSCQRRGMRPRRAKRNLSVILGMLLLDMIDRPSDQRFQDVHVDIVQLLDIEAAFARFVLAQLFKEIGLTRVAGDAI